MQKVFPTGTMPDAPVGGLFLPQDPTLRPERVCGVLGGNLLQFGSDAPFLMGGNALNTQEASV